MISVPQQSCRQDPSSRRQDPSSHRQGPGTLVWIGTTQQSPWSAAFRYCVEHAAQIAPRRSIDDLLNRPAAAVNRIVIVKPSRLPAPSQLEQLQLLAPQAERWTLTSAQSEGESRTGKPWPGFQNLYWHRWNQVLPSWFFDNVSSSIGEPAKKQLTIGVLSANRQATGGLVDFLTAAGHSVAQATKPQLLQIGNLDTVLWDDTAAPPASRSDWRKRLQIVQPMMAKRDGFPAAARHLWCVGFPRPDDVLSAKSGGVDDVFSKPYAPAAIGRACLAGCLR
ncbi:hypothetical protein SH139x_003693 [Planctomycetaceae bacterium SH139]